VRFRSVYFDKVEQVTQVRIDFNFVVDDKPLPMSFVRRNDGRGFDVLCDGGDVPDLKAFFVSVRHYGTPQD
jgi:hypothetical protein